jgi:hypothetical protein
VARVFSLAINFARQPVFGTLPIRTQQVIHGTSKATIWNSG